ncbi:MAG: hypothetical protein HFJ54_00435 [Clostridia bacterium]|nr:hypothetical protein [Clostridia bacterium]
MINILHGKNGEFSGKIKYELDNNEKYEVYRNFSKKNPIVYDDLGNDISKNYEVDKTYGNKFFVEQTKVDEELFNMSMVIFQDEVKLDEKKQNILIQKASNIMVSGEDDVSYSKIISKLNKRQADEIGTEKSPTKPLYISKKNIEELEKKKKEIEEILPLQYQIEEEKKELKSRIIEAEKELEIMQEIQKIQNELKIEKEKIKINVKAKEEIQIKKEIEEEKLRNIKTINNEKKRTKTLYIIPLLLIIISIILFVLNQKILTIITASLEIISFIIIFTIFMKEKQKTNKLIQNENQEKNNIKNKIELLENDIKEKEIAIKEIENEILNKENMNKEKIKNTFQEIYDIDNILKQEIESNNIIEEQKFTNELRLKLTKMELEKEEVLKKQESITNIEEKLENEKEELKKLIDYDKSINIAKEAIEKAYTQMKENITPKFTVNLSNTIKNITKRKI